MTTGLLVVDVQNGDTEGVDSAPAVVARIVELVEQARRVGSVVAWVQHDDQNLPRGSRAWQLVAPLRPSSGDLQVHKQHRSCFAGTGLAVRLREAGVHRILLVGAQSAFCVDMAGKHALAEGFDVTLVRDAHCNGPLATEAGVLDDAQVRGLVNRTWESLVHPGREVSVVAAADVRW